jgi:hypothetical protein
MSLSYLYIIAASEAGPVKLGVSDQPARRLKQLQTGHPQVLTIFHQEEVSADLVYFLEHNLHTDIRYKRLRGEWFSMTVAEAIGHVRFTLIHHIPSELVPIGMDVPIG